MVNENIFEKHPKKTIAVVITILLGVLIFGAEIYLSHYMGLGSPVLYDNKKVYGYRPLPNQETKRFHASLIKINNLGLRADKDWDPNDRKGKILFLGDSVTYGGSYIANNELFSHLVGKKLGLEAGNAGVNAWGVENVAALIMDHKFLPAKIYVSTFCAGDFTRGLAQIGHLPFWGHSPKYALKELFYYYLASFNHRRFYNSKPTEDTRKALIYRAAKRLKEMDSFLKSKGLKHHIFITPGRGQVLNNEPKDSLVQEALKHHDIKVTYIAENLKNKKNMENAFYDGIHLTKLGHEIWSNTIYINILKFKH